ncbi:MAG: hypothetical protein QOD77_1755 [Thermoplasmata archaeon]|jgi:PKD repeat protein|nr:hypothetical protein [Thermoplasmata archaeon]
MALAFLVSVTVLALATPSDAAQAAVQDGNIRMGVMDDGLLGIQESPAYYSASTSPFTLLRDTTTNNEVNANFGARANSWGVAYDSATATPRVGCTQSGYAFGCSGPPSVPFSGTKALTPTGSCGVPTAACEVKVCNDFFSELRVCHEFRSNPHPDIIEVTVTLESLRPAVDGPLQDVLYQRAMTFAPEPYTGAYSSSRPIVPSHMILEGVAPPPPALVWSSNQPASTRPPTGGYAPMGSCATGTSYTPAEPSGGWYAAPIGPCFQGALFELDLGDILNGSPATFQMFYGASTSLANARAAVGPAGVNADFWALGMHSSDPSMGTPNTFIWAFGGLSPPTASFTTSRPSPPPAAVFAATTVCLGDAMTFLDTSLPAGWPITASTWDFNDPPAPDASSGPRGSVTHTFSAPGTYTVQQTVLDDGGRTATSSQAITVLDCAVPVPDFAGEPCEGRAAAFTDLTPAGPHPYVSSQWIWGDSGATVLNPYATSTTHTYAASGTVAVTLRVTNAIGIVGATTKNIEVCPIVCPDIEQPGVVVAYESQRLLLPLRATDPNGPVLTFTMGPLAAGTFTAAPASGAGPLVVDGMLDWTPNPGTLGTVTVTFAANDTFCTVVRDVTFRVGLTPLADSDLDGVRDAADNCPDTVNRGQEDVDMDGIGDVCAPAPVAKPPPAPPAFRNGTAFDRDGDGILDRADGCPVDQDPLQEDFDRDGRGDACDLDADGDGVAERGQSGAATVHLDNCPLRPNPDQTDGDRDGLGDACDGPQEALTLSPPTEPPAVRSSSERYGLWMFALAFLATMGALGLAVFFLERRNRKHEPPLAKNA